MNDYEIFMREIKGREIVITETYKSGSIGFNLAHVLRNSAERE